jgi:hypothetical protein
MQHCVCCGRKKLPFAEYSVVKDQFRGTRPAESHAQRETFKEQQARIRAHTVPGPELSVLSPEPKSGGEYRARTGDLLVANQALSQLS